MQTTDLIKEKLDIADVIKPYVNLAPAGKNLKGLCPFHKEKTGSFMVSPDRQMWHCFGCGLGGDMFSFVMRYENVDFIEALKMLADKAGVDLKISGNRDERQYTVLYEINR
ncbi:MAG: CHC2 zinc finger domain-containing protein, partial [bacterium]|nr:CHC2 zinc finger domain-containing protein [bacterium]